MHLCNDVIISRLRPRDITLNFPRSLQSLARHVYRLYVYLSFIFHKFLPYAPPRIYRNKEKERLAREGE